MGGTVTWQDEVIVAQYMWGDVEEQGNAGSPGSGRAKLRLSRGESGEGSRLYTTLHKMIVAFRKGPKEGHVYTLHKIVLAFRRVSGAPKGRVYTYNSDANAERRGSRLYSTLNDSDAPKGQWDSEGLRPHGTRTLTKAALSA
jgi:hypothetical protein